MKNFATLVLALLSINFQLLFGQSEKRILPNWKVGDEIQIDELDSLAFIMHKPRSVQGKPEITKNRHILKIKSKTESSYLLEVTSSGFFDLQSEILAKFKLEEELKAIIELEKKANKLKFLVKINKNGKLTDLENWQEVKSSILSLNAKSQQILKGLSSGDSPLSDSIINSELEKPEAPKKVMKETLGFLEYITSGYDLPYSEKKAIKSPRLAYIEIKFPGDYWNLPAVFNTKLISNDNSSTQVHCDILFKNEDVIKQLKKSPVILMTKMNHQEKTVKLSESRNFVFDNATSWPIKIKVTTSLFTNGSADMNNSKEFIITKK